MAEPKFVKIGEQVFSVRYFYCDEDSSLRVVIDPGKSVDDLTTEENPFGDDFLVTQVQLM